ncbi:hypothetical protein RCL_jg13309.t1 [Rhizophagus clarus]|uniref:Uncharacterized protein n=1 Tax=Rhizophagus clarus TaxID=94130 RepID=A0A8H3LPG2_9GLOM|nr:hypothetical protein RCL_jg13309.t1 [Rhizophagus clarus]
MQEKSRGEIPDEIWNRKVNDRDKIIFHKKEHAEHDTTIFAIFYPNGVIALCANVLGGVTFGEINEMSVFKLLRNRRVHKGIHITNVAGIQMTPIDINKNSAVNP